MERKHLMIPQEELDAAAKLTGKTEPLEVFRELARLADLKNVEAVTKPLTEKEYWQTRLAKDRVLKEELHLAKEIQAMSKEDVDRILKTEPLQLPETYYCYKCHKSDHWANQCPNTTW